MIKVGDYFNIKRGNAKNISKRQNSITNNAVRLLSSSSTNNGGNIMVEPNKLDTVFSHCITVNNNGSVGHVFYHPYIFIASADVTVMIPKDGHKVSLQEGLFLKVILEKQTLQKFAYGFKISNSRLRDLRIDLPTTNGVINWHEMSDQIDTYLSLESASLLKTNNKNANILDLNSRKWKLIRLGDIADVFSGSDLPKTDRFSGSIPFIGSSSQKNGLTDFIQKIEGQRNTFAKNVISVNRNGSVGYAFYHPYEAYFSGDTRYVVLKNIVLTKEIGIFISTAISQQKKQFGYGFKLGTARLTDLLINLPILKENNSTPDFKFMNDYIRSLPNADLL